MRALIPFIFLTLILLPTCVFADAPIGDPALSPKDLEQAMKDADSEYHAVLQHGEQSPEIKTQKDSLSKLTAELQAKTEVAKGTIIEDLASQVETLKSRLAVERSTLMATQTAHKVKLQGAKTIFNYREEAVYEVTASVDHITDIELKAGEALTTPPTAGDTVRWNIAIMKSGAAEEQKTHIILKPLDENIETNLIISTDTHVYHLKIKSGDYCMPAVSWNYPEDNVARIQESLKREDSQEMTIKPEDLRFTYDVSSDESYAWKPIRVFDDGKKTFIQMPHEMRVSEAPALFLLEDGGDPMLVNYRVKGDYYIVDRLFQRAELRVGPKQTVQIELGKHKNLFERIIF